MKNVRLTAQLSKFLALALALLLLPLSACSSSDSEQKIGDYGTYGQEFALQLAQAFPFRHAYSQQEKDAAAFIKKELDKLGYRYDSQSFANPNNAAQSSENIIVRISGSGFRVDPENPDPMAFLKQAENEMNSQAHAAAPGQTAQTVPSMTAAAGGGLFSSKVMNRRIVFGAHYDTLAGEENRAAMPDHDGINDNASGVAVLLTLAKELKGKSSPFDIDLVFFGARYEGFQGSLQYLASLKDKASELECAYIVEGIYAGERLYAHAGRSSLKYDEKYLMRRRLYETTDIVLENDLYTTMDVGVYTNQAGFMVDVPGFGEQHLYREFTLKDADYLPFDSQNISCVYFDSYYYRGENLEALKESTLPAFAPVGGKVSNTNYDSSRYLQENLPEGQLMKRINAVAFILFNVTQRGIVGYKTA